MATRSSKRNSAMARPPPAVWWPDPRRGAAARSKMAEPRLSTSCSKNGWPRSGEGVYALRLRWSPRGGIYTMADKPSYLGLLNAISLAEGEAECYLSAWAATTPHEGVRQVISTVALREGEHSKAFAKRINELGFSVMPKANSDVEAKMAIAGSCELSDKEKFERLGVGREQND